jgi:hypothetical protein
MATASNVVSMVGRTAKLVPVVTAESGMGYRYVTDEQAVTAEPTNLFPVKEMTLKEGTARAYEEPDEWKKPGWNKFRRNDEPRKRVDELQEAGLLPAYGSKIPTDGTKGDTWEMVKADLKEAQKNGLIPAGLKLRTNEVYYGSYHVSLEQDDPDVPLYSCEEQESPYDGDYTRKVDSWEMAVAKEIAERVAHAYHWDESDTQTDYFSSAFYLTVASGYTAGARAEQDLAQMKEPYQEIAGTDRKAIAAAWRQAPWGTKDMTTSQCTTVARRLGFTDWPKGKMNSRQARFHLVARYVRVHNKPLGDAFVTAASEL